MSNINTQWRITVAADTTRARSELKKFAATAQAAGMSMEEVFSNVKGAPVARTFNNMGRELNRMNVAVQKSKVHLNQWGKYWQNSNNLIRYSKQLQSANSIAIEKTNGSMSSATLVMKRFNTVAASTVERLAYMNTFFRAASRQAINAAKNIQWAGRQITVGFGVPFGLAMTGASMAFLQFEEQLVRFRKVFNAEMSDLSIEEAEQRIVSLANTMSTQLGVARNEVMETSALFAQMGYGVEEIERLTAATTELAMLGETNAQDAGKLLRAYSASGFVDAFIENGGSRDEFEDYIKNMLNMIENNTGLSIASMVESGMAQLIPLFSQMGIGAGIGESILAGMTEALGGRTSEAVTALKAIMQRVYDESAETTEQFGLIGIDIEALQEEYKSDFVGLITELGDTLANNPAIQGNNKAVAETFGNLFGVRQANRAIAGLKAVSSAFDSSGEAANDYGRALNAIEDPQEAATRAAAELQAQAESVGGQLRRLKEAILIEASDIGETFLEMIMPLVRGVRNAIEWFGDLSDSVKRASIWFGGLIVAAGGILTTFGVLTQAILYMARTVGFFLPKFRTWTEQNVKQKIATDHVNQSLKEQRATLNNIIPIWERIERAQREATQATLANAAANEKLNSAMTGKAYGGSMSYEELNSAYGTRQAARHGGMGTQHPRGPGWAPAPLTGAARMSKQNMYSKMFTEPAGNRMQTQANIIARNRALREGGNQSSIRWRGGAAAAGGLLGLGSMAVGGKAGDAMMGGALGLEGLSILANKKVLNGMTKISDGLVKSAKAGSKLTAGLKTGAANLLTMGGGMPLLTAGIAAIAGSAYLIAKHMRESKERANELRNEFEYAANLGDELGLQLAEGGGVQKAIVNGMEALDPEDFEQSSDAIKSVVADVQRVSQSNGDVQRVFRNLARDWMAGGATLEEVQDSLDQLEAKIGVEIDEVDSTLLQETVQRDIMAALEASTTSMSLDTTFWNDIWGSSGPFGWGKDAFGSEGTQVISNRVSSLTTAIDTASRMAPDEALSFLEDVNSELETQRSFLDGRNLEEYDKQFTEILSDQLGVPKEIRKGFEDAEDVLSFYYDSLVTDQEYLNSLTEEQRQTLFDITNSVERWEGFGGDVYSAFEGVDLLTQDTRQELNMMANEMGRLAGFEGADILWNPEDLIRTGDRDLLEDYVAGLEDMADNAELGQREMAVLKAIIDQVNAALNKTMAPGAGHYGAMQRAYEAGRWGGPDGEEETTDGAEIAAEADVESYVGAFRSALDSKRSEIIDSILDAFDEASDARMEALEEERDARIELLEEQRDAEKKAIEEQRDAEIEAIDERIEKIDEYVDKQKDIQDALQNQIDLSVALASGDRGAAAQIQNAMRFGTIEDAANTEKSRLDAAKDSINEEYDEREERREEYYKNILEGEKEAYEQRIEQEKRHRAHQREHLEDSLEDLENMFLGSEAAWNRFYNTAVTKANGAGVQLEGSLRNGFQSAMHEIEHEMKLDEMWEGAEFPNLVRAISDAVGAGVTDGAQRGIKDVSGALEAANAGTWDTFDPDMFSSNDDTKQVKDSWRDSLGVDFFHSGGKVGGGAPKDVPAILQTGEYVMQRSAVEALGEDFLAQLNNYHSGGSVKNTEAAKAGKGFRGIGQMLGEALGPMLYSGMGPSVEAMDPSKYGSRSWGRIAPNTKAAQNFIDEAFQGVRGAYASVDRGNPRSDHSWGKALDVMTAPLGQYSDDDEKKTGWQVANFFRNNPDAFGTKYIIWQGMISNGSVQNWKWRPYTRMSGPTGGHYDHVHVSFLHGGGLAGKDGKGTLSLAKGGRLKQNNVPAMLHKGETVLRAPVAKSLEEGIMALKANAGAGGGDVHLHIDNFHGTEDNIDMLADKVVRKIERHKRKVNPVRRVG